MKRFRTAWFRTFIYTVLAAAFLITSVDIYRRALRESQPSPIETAFNYRNLVSLSQYSLTDLKELLANIQHSEAITTIILNEQRIEDFIENGQATLLTGYEIENSLRIGQNYRSLISHLKQRGGIKKQNVYMVIDQYRNYNFIKDTLMLHFSPNAIQERGFNILELSTSPELIRKIGVGFDTNIIEQLQSYGFNVIPRFLSNPHASKQLVQYKFSQLEKIDGVHSVAFEEPYLGANTQQETVVDMALDHNYHVVLMSNAASPSFVALAQSRPSILLSAKQVSYPIDSITEQPIQLLLESQHTLSIFDLDYAHLSPSDVSDTFKQFLSTLSEDLQKNRLPLAKEFIYPNTTVAVPSAFKTLILSLTVNILLLFMISKFVVFRTEHILGVSGVFWLMYLSLQAMAHPIVWDRILLFLVVLIFPCLALILSYPTLVQGDEETRLTRTLKFYASTIGFCILGGLLIISITYSSPFLLGYAQFYGVFLSIILSLGVSAYYFIIGPERIRSGFYILRRSLRTPISGITLISLGIVSLLMFAIWFRESFGLLNTLEASFHSILRDYLFLRPRFKEFAVGFPALLMASYGLGVIFPKRWTWFFLSLGSLGLVSILHSFCIVNTPLIVLFARLLIATSSGILFFLLYVSLTVLIKRLITQHYHHD